MCCHKDHDHETESHFICLESYLHSTIDDFKLLVISSMLMIMLFL